MYDKRDDFDFDIVNFPFLDGDVPRRPSYGVYILTYRNNPSYIFNGNFISFGALEYWSDSDEVKTMQCKPFVL